MAIWNKQSSENSDNREKSHWLNSRVVAVFFILLSFAGFVDASYLTVKHYQRSAPTCHIVSGCEQVLFSTYSTIAGVPVSLAGVIYYLGIFILSLAYFNYHEERILILTAKLTGIGFLASLYFLYLQVFVIKSFCQYCLLSALISTILFVLGLSVLHHRKRRSNGTGAELI